ncbi:hypothetical protein B4089_1150 [Bacillus licheniformis]|nr:hypothetical protein B4089_1150 [Bacillus licheniformis]
MSSVILAHAVLQTLLNFNTTIPNCLLFASISLWLSPLLCRLKRNCSE